MDQVAIERFADNVLSQFWGDRDYPVDPAAIAFQLGFKIIETILPDGVNGAIVVRDNQKTIFINKTDHIYNKRFTCAHELGHYFDKTIHNDPEKALEILEFRDGSSSISQTFTDAEGIANLFAASLLIPEKALKRMLKKDDYYLVKYFQISPEDLEKRKKSLNIG